MYNEKEKAFMAYWKANREREKKLTNQFLFGIPIGLLFAVPILLMVFSGRFWYKRADAVAHSQVNPAVLLLAVLLIAGFMAVFYKKHQWDRKEQFYQELLEREKKSHPDHSAEQR